MEGFLDLVLTSGATHVHTHFDCLKIMIKFNYTPNNNLRNTLIVHKLNSQFIHLYSPSKVYI